MNSWVFFVIAGQFLNSIVIVVDRHIVASKKVLSPIIYTFYVSVLSGFVVVMLPFSNVTLPGKLTIILSLASALSYIVSIFFLYKSLQSTSPLEVVPVVGGVAALSTF